MAILITGAGLVGSLCAARLLAESDEQPILYDVAPSPENLADKLPLDRVALVRGDIGDLPDLLRVLQSAPIQAIIHTAGLLTWMVNERPYAGVRINLLGTLNVLEAARLAGVARVVFCSSSTVYFGLAEGRPAPMAEDFALRTTSEYPPSVYASMKLSGEWLGQNYARHHGLDFAAVRFGGVFGPWRGQPSGGPSRVMQEVLEAAHANRPARLSAGDLDHPGTDYVYARDAAQGAVRAALAPSVPSRIYNIALGQAYPLRAVLAAVEQVQGRPLAVDVLPAGTHSGYTGVAHALDLSRARAELGYEPEFPLEAAIRDYLAWLRQRDGQ
jgi:nucleoside-diphosphate-sugar epimerase